MYNTMLLLAEFNKIVVLLLSIVRKSFLYILDGKTDSRLGYATEAAERQKYLSGRIISKKPIGKRNAISETNWFSECHLQWICLSKHLLQFKFKKQAETAIKDRDNAVIKYAQREKEILKLEANDRKCLQQLEQINMEKEALNARLRGSKNEKEQLLKVLEQKVILLSYNQTEVKFQIL